MAKYARGKKSKAISDRSGLRIKYTELKTTWDGLRVSPEDWEPKHPQLTPAKNVIDATALFNPRPDTDPENISFFVGYMYDPFLDPRDRPTVGVNSFGGVGDISLSLDSVPSSSGLGGTGAIGTETFETETGTLTGVAGTGGVGVEIPAAFVTGVSGGGGTGAVGVEALSISIDEAGVAGTGAVGSEALVMSINEAGVSGAGGVGNESAVVDETFWGSGDWSEGTWGN